MAKFIFSVGIAIVFVAIVGTALTIIGPWMFLGLTRVVGPIGMVVEFLIAMISGIMIFNNIGTMIGIGVLFIIISNVLSLLGKGWASSGGVAGAYSNTLGRLAKRKGKASDTEFRKDLSRLRTKKKKS